MTLSPVDTAIRTPCVVIVIGAAGSGKTRIAAAFPRSWRLSLDVCRYRVADDAGAQDSTPAAVAVFDTVLNCRLARRLPTVLDATHVEVAVRARLVDRAHSHGLPAVAIVARTPLKSCLARQEPRPANRQVPAETVAWQHQNVPTAEQLLSEGFDQVHDAAELDLMRLLLERSAAAGLDRLADIRADFGDDLADVFAFHPDSPDSTGSFAIAGREITMRPWDGGEPGQQHWQARVDGETCQDCGGTVWVKVTGPIDLLDVYNGGWPEEPFCDVCDVPDWARI